MTTGSQATFVISGGQTNTAGLSSMPGNVFKADTVLPDPQQAGMQIVLHWPYSANVHCEIDVDDNVFTQVDQMVAPVPNGTDPMNGALAAVRPRPVRAASRWNRPTPTRAGKRRRTTAPWRRHRTRHRRSRARRQPA